MELGVDSAVDGASLEAGIRVAKRDGGGHDVVAAVEEASAGVSAVKRQRDLSLAVLGQLHR